MSMNIYAKTGDLVVVTEQTKNSGYPYDSEQVAELLELNKPYKVVKTEVESFSTKVYIEGFVLPFNSVNFEDYNPLPAPAVDELNLDEAAKAFNNAHPNMDSWSSFIAGAEWQSHHNHASFVALVEGIEKLIVMQEKSAVRYKACFGDKNPGGEQIYEYFALQLKNLLNKIK